MKTIIAGSRTLKGYDLVCEAVEESGFKITEVVCGMAPGIDRLGKLWAKRNGIPVKIFRAPWRKYGKAAGHIRNRWMGDYADALIAIWDGVSPGTKGMIEYAKRKRLRVFVKIKTYQFTPHEVKNIKHFRTSY